VKKVFFFLAILISISAYYFYPKNWEEELKLKVLINRPAAWMIAQIQEDLSPYQSGITKGMLDALMDSDKADYLFVRYKIQKNVVSMSCPNGQKPHPNMVKVYECLNKMAHVVTLPDVEFVLSIHDTLWGRSFPGPVFSYTKKKTQDQKILFPNHEALEGYHLEDVEVQKGREKYSWKKKKSKIFWRGGATGCTFSAQECLLLDRAKAVSLSLKLPDMIDAKFTNLIQCTNPKEALAAYPHYFGDPVSIRKHLSYKYQLLLDGNSCAFARAYWQLFSGCTTLKQDSEDIQWFYRELRPYEHFVPVAKDLNDLEEKFRWLIKNDRKAKKISQNAYKFAQKNLKYSDILYYVYLVLSEYKKLQGF
jgi:hypothetical protein